MGSCRLRYDPLIVFRRQNRVTFIFIKTMSHDLLAQMAYCLLVIFFRNREENSQLILQNTCKREQRTNYRTAGAKAENF